jgi:hyaluronoglucosaminidase
MDSFKIDGSAYHHCNNYPAYAIGGLNGATQMIYLLSGSEFAIGELAHQTVKNALMAMRFYCNKLSFPLSLSGRHPDGKGQLSPMHYAYMAWAGTPNGANELDESMAAAYLRLTQNTTNNKEKQIYREFRLKGISPEADPQGNLSLGYSCATVQRRDNWAAVVRGTSRYLWCSEHYTGENLYGRYLGYGSLLLSTAPKGIDVTLKTSGWQEEGFDWNRIPGATSIHLPYDDLKAKILNVDTSSGVEEMLLSDEAFAGGLSQQKTNGNFGLKLHEHDKYNGSFRARKSFHFFNDDIICLGSNIENNDKQHPTETTVFQLAADDPQTQTYWQTYQPQSNTCLDALGTGYYSPNPWTFTGLIQQQSRNNDTNKPNTGQWVSLYIPHGTAPTGAEYEYAVLPKVNPERLKTIASKPFYTVIKKDRDAHIVRHEPTHTMSYVIFETPKSYLPGGPVLLTDTTCLAMVRQVAKNKLILTVAQPDLNLYSGPNDDIYQDGKRVERSVYSRSWIKNASQELPVRVTLLGDWDFTPTANIRLVERKAKTTTLEFMCKDGLSYELELNKR